MQMQSSHICTVGLCFLACKPSSFWSIFQKNSVKRVFGPSPYCYFCQSRPMVGSVFIAILLFLSVTPYGWQCVHRHIAVYVSHALWLAVCSSPYCCFCQSCPMVGCVFTWYVVDFLDVCDRKLSRRGIRTSVHLFTF